MRDWECGLGGGSGSWMVVLIVLMGIHVSVLFWTVRRHVRIERLFLSRSLLFKKQKCIIMQEKGISMQKYSRRNNHENPT